MKQEKLLAGTTILDFSHRLPGPMAGKIMADLGATVIKIEDHIFQDAFLQGLFADMDNSFPAWYAELNKNKKIMRFNLKDPQDHKKILTMAHAADGIIMGLPDKVKNAIGLTEKDILGWHQPVAMIEMAASKNQVKAMHDLNALAMSGLLSLYTGEKNEKILNPPFLPVAGIAFGVKVATDLMAAMLKVSKTNKSVYTQAYLYEATDELFHPFWPTKMREIGEKSFLHNGRYPCYNLYQTKDKKYIALAAVEEKFWIRFCEVFTLNLGPDDRFHFSDRSVFQKISACIQSYTQSEIADKIKDEDFCLSIVAEAGPPL